MNRIYILLFSILLIITFFIYNSLIRLANQAQEAWADVEAQLKRRFDLINNLVEVVKGYAAHEKKTLEQIVEIRAKMSNSQSVVKKDQGNMLLTGMLKNIMAIAENYPKLQASESFLKLQQELTNTEDTIEKARRYYNGTVRELNVKIDSFPFTILANLFGFKTREFFGLTSDEERQAINISRKQL